jgi:hypothetical protein
MTELLTHSLFYGGILSAVMTVLIVGSLAYNPEIWLHDFPKDVQERYGPASPKSIKQRNILIAPFMLLLIGILAAAVVTLPLAIGRQPGFFDLFLSIFIVFMTFNLVDLVIIDFGLVLLQPKFIILPGTEGLKGLVDYGFHVRGFLKGTAGGLLGSLVLAGLAWIAFNIFS